MSQLIFCWAVLLGPIYFVLLVGLQTARHFFPDERILFELSESMLIVAAAVLTAAAAGLLVQLT